MHVVFILECLSALLVDLLTGLLACWLAVRGTIHLVSIRSSTAAALRSGDEERLEQALSVQAHKLASASASAKQVAAAASSASPGLASPSVHGGSVEEKQGSA